MSEGAEVISSTHMTVGVGRRAGVRRFVAGTVLGALVLAVSAWAAAASSAVNTNTRKRSTSRSTARRRWSSTPPALSALRGAPSFDDGNAGVDRDAVRRFFQSPVTDVTRVSRPWERHGRKFVQVRVATADIRSLSKSVPFAWSALRSRRAARR